MNLLSTEKIFTASSWSSNLDSYVDDDPWYLFEIALTLEQYWNDCYRIFEHITKYMVVPLLDNNKVMQVKKCAIRMSLVAPKIYRGCI